MIGGGIDRVQPVGSRVRVEAGEGTHEEETVASAAVGTQCLRGRVSCRVSIRATQVPRAGTGAPLTGAYTPSGAGDATTVEFAGETDEEEGPEPFDGAIVDRSLTHGVGHG